MKWVFHFILSHSIFIAGCSVALSLQSLQLLSIPYNGYQLSFIFFATLGGYNTYWMVSRYTFCRPVVAGDFLRKNKTSLLVILVAIIGMVFCMTQVNLMISNLLIAFSLLVLYAIPILPFKPPALLKKSGILKTGILAFAWTIMTTLVPLQMSMLNMGQSVWMVFACRFLFMLLLCIIFDKRDAAVDKIRGLQSLAAEIKPRLLHYLFALVFLGYTGSCYLLTEHHFSFPQVMALTLSGVVTVLVYIVSLQKRGYLFYYFVVDGLMFLTALLTWMGGGW